MTVLRGKTEGWWCKTEPFSIQWQNPSDSLQGCVVSSLWMGDLTCPGRALMDGNGGCESKIIVTIFEVPREKSVNESAWIVRRKAFIKQKAHTRTLFLDFGVRSYHYDLDLVLFSHSANSRPWKVKNSLTFHKIVVFMGIVTLTLTF